jgi:hypothetical protein
MHVHLPSASLAILRGHLGISVKSEISSLQGKKLPNTFLSLSQK